MAEVANLIVGINAKTDKLEQSSDIGQVAPAVLKGAMAAVNNPEAGLA